MLPSRAACCNGDFKRSSAAPSTTRLCVFNCGKPKVYPDASARAAFARRLGVEDLFYAERRFRAVGEREGFPVFNLAPGLQSYADEHKVFLHGFAPDLGNGHWNEEGHRVAGEMLAQWLCNVGLDEKKN